MATDYRIDERLMRLAQTMDTAGVSVGTGYGSLSQAPSEVASATKRGPQDELKSSWSQKRQRKDMFINGVASHKSASVTGEAKAERLPGRPSLSPQCTVLKPTLDEAPAKKMEKGTKSLYEQGRKLKAMYNKLYKSGAGYEDPDNIEALSYGVLAGLKFIEHAHTVLESSKRSKAADMFKQTADYFDFFIKKYHQARRNYISAIVLECKAWCCHQVYTIKKDALFASSSSLSQKLKKLNAQSASKRGPESANSFNSGPQSLNLSDASPQNPTTPLTPSSQQGVVVPADVMRNMLSFFDNFQHSIGGWQLIEEANVRFPSASFLSENRLPKRRNLETFLALPGDARASFQTFSSYVRSALEKGAHVVC